MSTKNHHTRGRTVTPQPMDVSEVAGALQRKLQLEETVDDKERANPQFCTEYVQEIYQYLEELEVQSVLVVYFTSGVMGIKSNEFYSM